MITAYLSNTSLLITDGSKYGMIHNVESASMYYHRKEFGSLKVAIRGAISSDDWKSILGFPKGECTSSLFTFYVSKVEVLTPEEFKTMRLKYLI